MEWHAGIWRVRKIQEKKQRHTWANQVMTELVQRISSYKYDNTGQNPQQTQRRIYGEESEIPNPALLDETTATERERENNVGNNSVASSPSNYQKRKDQTSTSK